MSIQKCNHKTTRGKAPGASCNRKALAGGFCSRHKKKSVSTDLTNDPVFKAGAKPNTPQKKFNFSSFKITINTNKDFSQMTTSDKTKFKHFMEFVFSKERIPKYLEDAKSPEDSTANIVELVSEYYFEVGEEQHRLHSHGIVKLKHTGFYKLKTEQIRQLAKKIFGDSVYLNIIAGGNSEEAWSQYMKKSSAANKVDL